ncbi:MAG: MATE family efflux transporter [Lachnospiraceae bacterium]
MILTRKTVQKQNMVGNLFSNQQLRVLIWPLILEQVLVMSVGLTDTVMVSTVGEAAVSGVSLVDMISQLMISVLAALATGGAVIAAQFLGGKRYKEASATANQLFLVLLIFSICVAIPVLIFREAIITGVFGPLEPKVMQSSVTYLWISALSFPFLALYNGGGALFRAMGNSKMTLKVALLMNVINIISNSILIFGLNMGVAGSAFGSLIARACSALIINLLLRNKNYLIHYQPWKKIGIQKEIIRKILFIAIPSGIEGGIFQIGRILVVSIIAGFGTTQIAANAVANNFDGLGIIPGGAMMLAMITVVGQCVGAGDYEQAEYYIKKLMKITYLAFLIWDGFLILTLPWTIQIYSLSPETIDLAIKLIYIHDGMAILLWPASFVLPNALRAGNDVRYTMVVSVLSMMIFRLFFSYLLGVRLGMGAMGVWIAMTIDWTFRNIFFIGRYFSRKWQKVRM